MTINEKKGGKRLDENYKQRLKVQLCILVSRSGLFNFAKNILQTPDQCVRHSICMNSAILPAKFVTTAQSLTYSEIDLQQTFFPDFKFRTIPS